MVYFNLVVITISFFLCACVSTPHPPDSAHMQQEDILLKTENYSGLISLYRSQLRHKDTPEVRFKLAHYYYLTADHASTQYYLTPLLHKNNLAVDILNAKNMIALGEYPQALTVTQQILQYQPDNADAYNLQGIALALSGDLVSGRQAIAKSRELFIDDNVALNNMAMIALLEKQYQEAVRLLLPQYLQGKKQSRLLHNLVFSLVKVGDHRYAYDIIHNENLSTSPDELIETLMQLEAL